MIINYLLGLEKRNTSASNDDVEVVSVTEGNRQIVKIKAKKDIILDVAEDYFPLNLNKEDVYFLNGYQSWTDTKEFSLKDKLKNIKHAPSIIVKKFVLEAYGDSTFYQYSSKKMHGYDVFYSKGKEESFLYSLNFETAYLIFEINKDHLSSLHLISDVKNIALKAGEEVTVFDYKAFHSYKEGLESFNKDFPLLNKEKVFGYTSWYNYYQNINEEIILRDLEALDDRVNVFQIDDGYETFVGDWMDVDPKKFPNGLGDIVKKIHAKGYKAGIWLAPFGVETKSKTFQEHKDWLVSDKDGNPLSVGGNWSGFYCLDIHKPEAREYLRKCLTYFMDLGFDFFKLDFLYASALYPVEGKSRCQVQKEAYDLLREILKDKLILGCGANIVNSYGVFDYLRIGPDVSLIFDDVFYMKLLHRERISTKITLQNTIYRSLLNQRWFGNDPDVFLLRDDNIKLSFEQRKALTLLNALFGSVLMTSDNVATYDEEKKAVVNRALELFYNAKVSKVAKNCAVIDVNYTLNGVEHHLTYNTKKGVLVCDE